MQPLATDIPTAESLKITSSAGTARSEPSLPPAISTETSLKRDDWMLMPPSTVIASANNPRSRLPSADESFTEDYGDASEGARNLSGGVDFFSTLGTEVKKKKGLLDRPEVAPARHLCALLPY